MRLLLRCNAHREVDDATVEIAASPDTVGREEWTWQIRLVPLRERAVVRDGAWAPLPRRDGSRSAVEVSSKPERVAVEVQSLRVPTPQLIERSADEVTVFVAGDGAVLVESRHLLGDGDAMVFAGDDPMGLWIEPGVSDQASAVLVRLRARAGSLPWVP